MIHGVYRCSAQSPVGELTLVSDGTSLTGLHFDIEESVDATAMVEDPRAAPFAAARRQLAEYFAGELRVFDLPVRLVGTPFQRRVWREIAGIGYGSSASYREVARRLNQPGAVRAVGLASGRNPVAIVVPCHRVIGADGSLTGFGGGLARKRWLLEHEGVLQRSLPFGDEA